MADFLLDACLLHPDMRVALEAAWAAGSIVQKGWADGASLSEPKEYGDLFSATDKDADRAIQAVLRAKCPDDGVRSEELTPKEESENGRLWIVDPLDGSVGFNFRLGIWIPATLIALEVNGVVALSVVYFPLTGETFYAVKGKGAFFRHERLSTAWAPTNLAECCVEMNHHANSADETSRFAQLWQRLRSPEGALAVSNGLPYSGIAARIARGEPRVAAVVHDNNPGRSPKQCLWDVAAPRLVLEEAGGVVLNLRGEPYNPRRHEPFVCAANEAIARQIIALAVA